MDATATGGASVAAAHYQAAAENLKTEKADNAFLGEIKLKKTDGTIVTSSEGNLLSGLKLENIAPKLSPEMLSQMIQSMQKITDHMDHRINQTQEKGSDEIPSDGTLPTGVKNGLDDIANDPVYAAKRAREMGTFPHLNAIDAVDFPKNGDPAHVWEAFHAKTSAMMEHTGQVTRDRSAYYKDMVSKGMPPAEIYAKLLEFNANLPQTHPKPANSFNSYAAGGWEANNRSQHDYLMKALAKA